jgi:hypothetical protein
MNTFGGFRLSSAYLARLVVALLAGFFSACLLYLLVNSLLLSLASITLISTTGKLSLFLETWGFSVIFLFRSTKSLKELTAKAFLLGSVEWLAVALAGVFLFSGRPYLGAGMAFVCLIGFGITQIWSAHGTPNDTGEKQEKKSDRFSLAHKPPT